MTRDEAIKNLEDEIGSCTQRNLSEELTLVVIGPLAIAGSTQKTKVAFKLPSQIDSVPLVYVETHVTLNNGGQPANVANEDIEGEPWKRWSFKTRWDPKNYSMAQLAHAAVSIFYNEKSRA